MPIRLQHYFGTVAVLLCPLLCFSQSTQLADSLNRRGMEFYKGGQYRQAEFYLQEAFRLYQKQNDSSEWLCPGIDYAEILVDRSKYKQALELLKRLKKVAQTQRNIKAQARIENDFGWSYNKTGQHDIALSHLEKAIPLAQKVRDTLRLGYINDNIGGIYRNIGEYRTSLKYHKKALPFYQKLGEQQSIAIALNNIGLTYKKLLLYDKALEYYERSLAIRKRLDNEDLLATSTSNIAGLYKQLGNLDQALVYYQQSLSYCRKAGNPVKTAQTLNNIGALYKALGQPERELAYYHQSLQFKEQFANAASLAITYSNMARSYLNNGQPKQALTYYQQALNLRKQAGNPVRIAYSLLDLSQIELTKGNIEAALAYLHEAKSLARSTQDKPLQLRIKMEQGNIFRAQDNLQDALDSYQAAYEIAKQMSGTDQLWPLHSLARTFDQLSSPKAISTGRKVITIIEKQRSQTGPLSQLKAGFFKQHVNFYEEMASWLLKYNKDFSGAYNLIELAKARALTDELAQAAQHIDELLPEEERIRRAQKISEISDLYSSLKKAHDTDAEKTIQKIIRRKELDYYSYEHTLQEYYPQYKSFKKPEPISLKKAQELCDAETAILEYAVIGHELLIFFITNESTIAKRVSIDESNNTKDYSTLSNEVSNFRAAILSHASLDSIRILSKPLYAYLIAPFEQELADYRNLIIVPDQILAYLPFEALSKGNNYLISQYNIKYIPSITGYQLIRPPKNNKNSILTISNSSAKNTPVLPSADTEIKSIAQLFSQPVMLKNKASEEDSVKVQMQKGYNFIHIASHSIIDEKNPALSGIFLPKSSSASDSKEDGFLRSSEIYGLHISSNLVVLSACESGLGKLINGEGMLGLQRAFLNAGASAVVVSLWDVYDRSTSHFMATFYKRLLHNPERSWYNMWTSTLRWIGWDKSVPFGEAANALRQAKLSMIQNPRYNHPVYWAPFIVIGR